MQTLNIDLIGECKQKLLILRTDLLNRIRSGFQELNESQKMTGDEADQTTAILEEAQFLTNQNRIRAQLLEVESALGRIENGQFGFCEETNEPIEEARLRAIPYTRLSIEGAEIREALRKKYVW